MITQLRHDIQNHPDVFWLENPLRERNLQQAREAWNLPSDLIALWSEFGTGKMFESEIILRPFAESWSVEFITGREKKKGLPAGLTAFHYGIFSSAFDFHRFHVFDTETYECLGHFSSLDDWYVKFIRKSWGKRYGIR